jgi:hypothetical protein
MGNEQPKSQKSRFLKEVTKRLTFVKEINDSRFGDVQIFRKKDGEDLVMVKGKWANDQEEYRLNMYLKLYILPRLLEMRDAVSKNYKTMLLIITSRYSFLYFNKFTIKTGVQKKEGTGSQEFA